jgi:hypothetical protein
LEVIFHKTYFPVSFWNYDFFQKSKERGRCLASPLPSAGADNHMDDVHRSKVKSKGKA